MSLRSLNRLSAAWLLALVLCSGLVWAITWYQPQPPVRVVLVGAGYQENLAVPHNAYGWRSLADFARLPRRGASGRGDFHIHGPPQELSGDFRWQDALGEPSEEVLLLLVSAHGGADGEGPYLVPNDSTGQRHERLRLDELFDRLAQLPPRQQKLVALDVTQIAGDWRLGMLHNEFARELTKCEQRIRAIPNLVVLCASDADQQSWICDQWRRTVFLHFLLEGIQGAAPDEDQDGRISAAELHDWLTESVSAWAAANRGAAQTPLLLPGGETGRRRARQIHLAVASQQKSSAAGPLHEGFVPPRQLEKTWQRYEELLRQTPPGYACAPALWREYVDTVLRYEELIRAGETTHAERMHQRLAGVEYQMQREQAGSYGAVQNSLSAFATAGVGALPRTEAVQILNELWNAEEGQHASLWQKAAGDGGEPAPARGLLRLALLDALADRVAEDPPSNLATAAAIAEAVRSPLHPLPAEIHFLLMLHHHLPADTLREQSGERVGRALELRRLAERAAVGRGSGAVQACDEVLPWIAQQVKQGDQQRRLGEDLLFAGAADRPKADVHFAAAERCYRHALEEADRVAAAIAVRDMVLAKLPYYSQWLADATMDPYVANARHHDLLAQAEELWHQTHRLVEMLESPDPRWVVRAPPPSSAHPQPRSLVDLRGVVKLQFDGLVNEYEELAKAMAGGAAPAHWHAAHRALRVPHPDVQLRMQLLVRMRDAARRVWEESLHGKTAASEGKLAVTDAGDDADPRRHSRRRAMTTAHWQGRMALAVLGSRDFTPPSSAAPLETYEQLCHRLEVFEVEQAWWESMIAAGEQIHARYAALPRQIDEPLSDVANADPRQLRGALVRAGRLVRQIDGAQARRLSAKPAILARRMRLHDLAVFLAERTLDDHWYDIDPLGEPYFRRAALSYLNEAQRLYPQSKAAAACRDRLDESGQLEFGAMAPLHLSSQKRLQLDYQLRPANGKGFTAGFPVSWLTSGAGVNLVEPAAGERIVRRFDAQGQGGAVAFTIDSPPLVAAERRPPAGPGTLDTQLTLHGFFRGQVIQSRLPVRLHLRPEITMHRHPLPEAAAVALSASEAVHRRFGDGTGAVAFVLDCSGSMGPPAGSTDAAGSKYAEAVAALREVLQKVPQGTQISLWMFGEAMGPERTAAAPEQTIRRVQDPIVWNPHDATQLARLMAKIDPRHVQPWNESPIVRTILAAKADVEDAAGFRAIVVITDGMDNRFAHDRVANPHGQAIPDALSAALENSGVSLNVVAFKVAGGEQAKVREQFAVVKRLFPPGGFYRVDQTEYLAATLAAALDARLRFQMNALDAGPSPPALELGYEGRGEVWPARPVLPGVYRLQTHPGRPLEAEITLHRGDLLALSLRQGPGGPEIVRPPYSTTAFPQRPFAQSGPWRATLLQGQIAADNELHAAVALEKLAADSCLEQPVPRTIWFEAVPQSGSPGGVAWGRRLGFPMPVWSLRASDWPMAVDGREYEPPQFRIWWRNDTSVPYAATLQRDPNRQAVADLWGVAIQSADQTVRAESVAVERHFVEVAPGRRAEQPCLVVRLQSEPQSVYWAEPLGLETAGAEHRFYPSVGSYTGLFWPVTEDIAARSLQGIGVVSLAAFQREAARGGNFVQFKGLPAPDPNDILPTPSFSFD